MRASEVIPEGPRVAPSVRLRLAFVFSLLALAFVGVLVRLVQLQVASNPELNEMAKRQYSRTAKTAEYRLPILDRNGEELAVSVPSSSAFARPRLIPNKAVVARGLAKVLGGSTRRWLRKLQTNRSFVWLKRQMDLNTSRQLAALGLPGISLEQENKRVYPNGSLASHLIGFTDIDGHGLSGVEMSLNQELIVNSAARESLRDGRGKPSYIATRRVPQEERTGVFLTIDRRVQHVLEEELEQAMSSTGAKAAMAVVIDPFTGEVLAMGQRPTFDPNFLSRATPENLVNRLISHRYEPGSTMKVLFAADAIEKGILNPNSPIDCEGGKYRIGNVTIGEAEVHHKYHLIPLHRVIRHSSNIGAVKVALLMGAEKSRETLTKFGLVSRLGIGLPGEVSSPLRPSSWWKPLNLASVGFGQGIAVTPLQMAASFSAFANGGFWVRPKVLLEDVPRPEDGRKEIRRVLSAKTVDKVKEMLVAVTQEEDGTGRKAQVPGVVVAGKTGTAQKYVAGVGYRSGSYFASFIGFVPADKPQFLVAVMVDEPKKPFYGGLVAAPVFSRIAERSLQILGKTPRVTVTQNTGDGQTVPQALVEAPTPQIQNGEGDSWIMPDLTGVSLREALSSVGSHASQVTIQGSGYLSHQSPAPGSVVSPTARVQLTFSPAVARGP